MYSEQLYPLFPGREFSSDQRPVGENSHSHMVKILFKDLFCGSGMVVHTLHPRTLEAKEVDLCEFETNLVYIASSRTARAMKSKDCLKRFGFLVKIKTPGINIHNKSKDLNKLWCIQTLILEFERIRIRLI